MNSWELLRGGFSEDAVEALKDIICAAAHTANSQDLGQLQRKLSELLRGEMTDDRRFWQTKWVVSSNEENHILMLDHMCFLVNIYGVQFLFQDYRFCEGELDIVNFEWIEEDHLVLFDSYYIVRGRREKVICHYAEPRFCYIVPPEEKLPFEKDTVVDK